MGQTCKRCYRVVDRACQSDTEAADCLNLQTKRAFERVKHGERRGSLVPLTEAAAEANRGTLAQRVARHKKRLRAKYPGVK